MQLSRRRALQAFGAAAGVATSAAAQARIPATAATPAKQLRDELDACTPDGDPLDALLQRNHIFSRAWQRSTQASDPPVTRGRRRSQPGDSGKRQVRR